MLRNVSRTHRYLIRLLRDTRGVSALEYGMLAGLVAIASVQALGGLGDVLDASFGNAASQVGEPAPVGGAGPEIPVTPDVTSSGGDPAGPTAPILPPSGDPLPDPDLTAGSNGGSNSGGGAYEPPVAAADVPQTGFQ